MSDDGIHDDSALAGSKSGGSERVGELKPVPDHQDSAQVDAREASIKQSDPIQIVEATEASLEALGRLDLVSLARIAPFSSRNSS